MAGQGMGCARDRRRHKRHHTLGDDRGRAREAPAGTRGCRRLGYRRFGVESACAACRRRVRTSVPASRSWSRSAFAKCATRAQWLCTDHKSSATCPVAISSNGRTAGQCSLSNAPVRWAVRRSPSAPVRFHRPRYFFSAAGPARAIVISSSRNLRVRAVRTSGCSHFPSRGSESCGQSSHLPTQSRSSLSHVHGGRRQRHAPLHGSPSRSIAGDHLGPFTHSEMSGPFLLTRRAGAARHPQPNPPSGITATRSYRGPLRIRHRPLR
jgi:hypothetical protein